MLIIHHFVQKLDVALPSASDFMEMDKLEQFMISRQGCLEGSDSTARLRARVANLSLYQRHPLRVTRFLQEDLRASEAEFRKWQRNC